MYEAKPMPNGLRYEFGQKRCTFCGLFFLIDDVRCPCCKVVLRTNPRSRHKNGIPILESQKMGDEVK